MRCIILLVILSALSVRAQTQTPPQIPPHVGQLVVSIADTWNSSKAQLRCFQRRSPNSPWQPVVFSNAIPVLLGKHGMAWGRGAVPNPPWKAPVKREGDRRAPAGCFSIGTIYGYGKALPGGSTYPYNQVTKWDAWIDDVKNPYYNQHFEASPNNKPAWFEKQRMRLGDHAYTYLVEIEHNANPPQPGAGSAIFFHIRRGANRVTSGCTTMTKANLERMIQWFRAEAHPHYVLLPKAEYQKLTPIWRLPVLAEPAKAN